MIKGGFYGFISYPTNLLSDMLYVMKKKKTECQQNIKWKLITKRNLKYDR